MVKLTKKINDALNVLFILFIMCLAVTAMTGCANAHYQFGDASKAYCQSENAELRTIIKATLTSQGVNVGVDYCLVHGFAEMVIE